MKAKELIPTEYDEVSSYQQVKYNSVTSGKYIFYRKKLNLASYQQVKKY